MPTCNHECYCESWHFGPQKRALLEANFLHTLRINDKYKCLLTTLQNSVNQPICSSTIHGAKRLTFYFEQCKRLATYCRRYLIFEDMIKCKTQKRLFNFEYHWKKEIVMKIFDKVQISFNEIKITFLAKQQNECIKNPKCLRCAFQCTHYKFLLTNYMCPEIEKIEKCGL